jgi:S-methylmethionine-dependent homocysteine/selenocysteine methylase
LRVNSPKRRTPEAMAASMKWVLKSVAAIVGGCCQLMEDESDIKILRLPARRKTPRSGGARRLGSLR